MEQTIDSQILASVASEPGASGHQRCEAGEKGPEAECMAPLNSWLKVKVQVKLHCKSATRYQITGQGGCSEEIVPWPLGRSSCQGNGHVAPGAQGRNSAVLGGGMCGGAQHPRLCAGRTAPGFHTSRRRPLQFQKSKTGSFFPSNVTTYHHWSAPSLCSRTGVPKSCTMDRYAC